MAERTDSSRATLDKDEVERFSKMAGEWWDPDGKFRPLHQLGPARIGAIRDAIAGHYGRDPVAARPLAGLRVLDIGCGGGLVSEPLARLGATVIGIDPAELNIRAARLHAEGQGLHITYRQALIEDVVAEAQMFDCVLCLEVVEHVPDIRAFLEVCGKSVAPGGLMVLSTINRTLKSFALAIVGAEYVLRWLPVGTHDWQRFVSPDELERHLAAVGLKAGRREGLVYNPLTDRWGRSSDTDVNYVMSAVRQGGSA